jgi:phospholipase D
MMKLKKINIKNFCFLTFGFLSGFVFFEFYFKNENYVIVADQNIEVCFTPGGRCKDLIIKHISEATSEILLHSYSFTSQEIADALLRAHDKGVMVKILFDRSQLKAKFSQIPRLIEEKIENKIDKVNGIAHNKIMIIDSKVVITGSYNWTKSAEYRNSENILFIKNEKIANFYKKNWENRIK